MSLRSVEAAYDTEIELGNTEVVLCSSSSDNRRASFPFAIPLPPDTAQCLHALHSSLTHTLTARVYTAASDVPALAKSVLVHTRRYTSHTHELQPTPETWTMTEPSKVEVQLPRTTFRAGEPIPIYITVPTPPADFVVEQGMRLLVAACQRVLTLSEQRVSKDAVVQEIVLNGSGCILLRTTDAHVFFPISID